MAGDPLDDVLRLVAEGRLSADEAAPILAALDASPAAGGDGAPESNADADPGRRSGRDTGSAGSAERPRTVRIEVTDGGRPVVKLRLPIAVGKLALDHIPGLPPDQVSRVREALATGFRGSVFEVDDDGDSVRIVLE